MRTELGVALRRANHRTEVREQLRRALELATICGGAVLLVARAEGEFFELQHTTQAHRLERYGGAVDLAQERADFAALVRATVAPRYKPVGA